MRDEMRDEFRLPREFVPTHYALSVYDLDVEAWTYAATVAINYSVRTPADSVTVNYKGLRIASAVARPLKDRRTKIPISGMHADPSRDVFTVVFGAKVDCDFVLTLMYSGRILDDLAGFYRSAYTAPGDDPATAKRHMLATQFSPTDARRAFPCADEPDLKATFDVTLAVPEGWTALGNMPAKSVSTAGGVTVVSFQTTPRMSTYVVGWAAGEFECISAYTRRAYHGGMPLRVALYTTPGLARHGRFQLDVATRLVDLFSELLDYDFVVPKLDLVAVHGMAYGAMENWGLVTFRLTHSLLENNAHSTATAEKRRIAYVTAHEIAHHWFGNVVTMAWWGDLWLKEGIATWLGWYAVDKLFPDWQVWRWFSTTDTESALTLDALAATHPIEVPVRSALEVGQIFDAVSYQKGAAVIRMLASTIASEDEVLSGIRRYLRKFEFGNAVAADLWDCIGQGVAEFMGLWTRQPGFPLVTVEALGEGRLRLAQERFLANGWRRPATPSPPSPPPKLPTKALSHRTSTSSLSVPECDPEGQLWPVAVDAPAIHDLPGSVLWDNETIVRYSGDLGFLVNPSRNAVYRTKYSEDLLKRLLEKHAELSVLTKRILLSDSLACAISGNGSTKAWLNFVHTFRQEKSVRVWTKVLDGLETARRIWLYDEVGIAPYIWQVIDEILERIDGWNEHEEDDNTMANFRIKLITLAANSNHPKHDDYFRDTCHAWERYGAIADRQILTASLGYVMRNTSNGQALDDVFVRVLREIKRPRATTSRQACVNALGQVEQISYVERALDLILSDVISREDMPIFLSSLSCNPVGQTRLWRYLQDNWKAFFSRFSTNMVNFGYIVDAILSGFASTETYDDMTAFFASKNVAGVDRHVAQGLEKVLVRGLWKQHTQGVLKRWLIQHTDSVYIAFKNRS